MPSASSVQLEVGSRRFDVMHERMLPSDSDDPCQTRPGATHVAPDVSDSDIPSTFRVYNDCRSLGSSTGKSLESRVPGKHAIRSDFRGPIPGPDDVAVAVWHTWLRQLFCFW